MLNELIKIGNGYFKDDLASVYQLLPLGINNFLIVSLEYNLQDGFNQKNLEIDYKNSRTKIKNLDEDGLKLGISDFGSQHQFFLVGSYLWSPNKEKINTSKFKGYFQDGKKKFNLNSNFCKKKENKEWKSYLEKEADKNSLKLIDAFYDLLLDDQVREKINQEVEKNCDPKSEYVIVFKVRKKSIEKICGKINTNCEDLFITEIPNILDINKNFYLLTVELEKSDNQDQEGGKSCNFCGKINTGLFTPCKNFYYPFTINQKNTLYGLDRKNLTKHFLICKNCYLGAKKGISFIEAYQTKNRGYFLSGLNYYLTFSGIEDQKDFLEFMKEILDYERKRRVASGFKSDIERVKKVLGIEEEAESKIEYKFRGLDKNKINLNWYFYEKGKSGPRQIIEYVKGVLPSRIKKIIEINDIVSEDLYFGNDFGNENLGKYPFSIFDFIRKLYDNDKSKKKKIHLVRKIFLDQIINYDEVLNDVIEEISLDVRNDKLYNFPVQFLAFINILILLNQGRDKIKSNFINFCKIIMNKESVTENIKSQNLFEGSSSLERLKGFISKNPYLDKVLEIKTGIYLGVIIAWISWMIKGYEKNILGYASRKLRDNDKKLLEKFIIPIQEKMVLHDIHGEVLTEASSLISQLLSEDKISGNDFVLGLFIGYNIAPKIKSEKNKTSDNSVKELSEE